jgi:predicted transcriptional regulator
MLPPDRLTPAELRERRKALSLSQGEGARRAGVNLRTWQRWEAEELDIPLWMDLFLKGMEYEAGIRTAPARRP